MNLGSAMAMLWLALMASCIAREAHGADQSLTGTWRLITFSARDVENGAVTKPWGERPTGLLSYSPGGQMSAVLTAEDRQPESGSADDRMRDRARLYTTLAAYAGTYTLTADGVVHHVEVASFPDWVGRDQVRYTSLDGDTLTITTPLRCHASPTGANRSIR